MAYQAAGFRSLGAGLNIRDKADTVSEEEAIDLLNVDFTETGTVKQREGFSVYSASALAEQPTSLGAHYESDGTCVLLVGAPNEVYTLSGSGGTLGNNTTGLTVAASTYPWSFIRYGGPGAEISYMGNGAQRLISFDGSTFTQAGTGTPKAGCLAISTGQGGVSSNRLVAAGLISGGEPTGLTAADPSTIWFSDPGLPETWSANNYLKLTPGDGEAIQAMISWREFLFVFKETKYFVFYGESLDAEGNPIFNYRTVDTGNGAIGPKAVAKDETGVYFFSREGGLMHTTGGDPTHLGEKVNTLWEGGSADYFLGGEINWTLASNIAVSAFDERIYVNYSTGGTTNERTLVYDTHGGWFTLWDVPANDMISFHYATTQKDRLFFTYPAGDNEVGFFNGDTSDKVAVGGADQAITSRWRSGWFDYGVPAIKRIRQTKVWGSGKVQSSVSDDFKLSLGTFVELDLEDPLGTSPTQWDGSTWGGGSWSGSAGVLQDKIRRRAIRGTVFSTAFYNEMLDQEWSVHRVEHHLATSRSPAIRDTE